MGTRMVTSRTSFLHSGRAKNGARAKRLKEGGGGGERRERLPANPSILKKTRSPTNRAPDWCGVVILIDKCFKFA